MLACDIRQFAIDERRINAPTNLIGSRSSDLDGDHSDTCSVSGHVVTCFKRFRIAGYRLDVLYLHRNALHELSDVS